MLRYLGKRALTYLVMIFLTTSAGYFLAVSSLKPALLEQEKIPRPSPEQVANSFRLLGLDPNLNPWERYIQWLGGILTRWDWGRSPNGAYVNAEFADRVMISTRLFIASIILTLIIGVALGVYSAARQYKFQDRAITSYSYLVHILPAPIAYFLVQLGAIGINDAVGERLFFVTGISTPGIEPGWPAFVDLVAHYAVPTFAMTVFGWAGYQIAQRQYLLDNVNADFVRTARAKGLTRNQAITRHALRVSFIPVAQSIAFTIPAIFTGGFFAEAIFAWPGVGLWSIDAIGKQDVNVATAMLAYGSVIFAIGAILADFATTLVDPRVRVQ
ncbi:ABC transporter permease [Arthrobacter cupressi]|uniref:ABC transporter permease n=1 Tax=Arthrobacter cupressi TaxID=1045773 RepID=UPI000945DAA5|nr:ABC transporter permease [Arthrobacter cupressi]NYD77810.1 peptide/nickel transport system permease protein [Arthrobacter cupressi]